jgi:hypothetical protein
MRSLTTLTAVTTPLRLRLRGSWSDGLSGGPDKPDKPLLTTLTSARLTILTTTRPEGGNQP